ncbi:MAG: hypothetical protein ACREQ1_05405 [Woeseiaceae bacterium]
MQKMPVISKVSPADYAELAAFLADFPDDRSKSAASWRSRMRAWWDLNPAYADGVTRGWLLRHDGKIVGFFGSIPWQFQLDGAEATVFAGTTWRVLAEHRGMSMTLKRHQMDEHRDALHFSTTPRPEVARMLQLLGYKPIARGPDGGDHGAIILNFRKVLRLKLQGRFPGTVLAACLAPVLRAVQSFRIRRLKHYGQGNIRELCNANEAFDELWNRTRTKYSNTHVRTAEAVNWYCFSSKETKKNLFGYFDGDRLLGYMICMPTERRGMTFFECVDLWLDTSPDNQDQDDVLGALVEKARQCAVKSSFDRVFLPHFDHDIAASLQRIGVPAMRAMERPEFFKGPRNVMETITAENSYFVLAEGDYGL